MHIQDKVCIEFTKFVSFALDTMNFRDQNYESISEVVFERKPALQGFSYM